MATTTSRSPAQPSGPPVATGPGVPAPPASPSGRPAAPSRWSTPVRLSIALVVAVVAGLLLAGAGLAGFLARADAVDRARAEADNLVTVQTARTRLLAADALAATTVLLGADASDEALRRYGYAIDEVPLRLAVASAAGNDRTELAPAVTRVTRYAAAVASARAQVLAGSRTQGAAAMLEASRRLGEDGRDAQAALPRIQSAQGASAGRLGADLDTATDARLLVLVTVALVLAALALVQLWLARRTRRALNPALLAGTLAALLAGTVAVLLLQHSTAAADEARRGPQRVVAQAVEARAALFGALSAESLELLAPSGTAEHERDWSSRVTQAGQALANVPASADSSGSQTAVKAYSAVHAEVARRLASGDREGAVALAADPRDTGSAGAFEAVDAATGSLLAHQANQLDAGLASAGEWLRAAGWLCLLAGLGVAVAGWRGVGARLAEYR